MSEKISIHALREEGDVRRAHGADRQKISIHALREEGDPWLSIASNCGKFISIHALREEGDRRVVGQLGQWRNFYPRPPRGGRLRILRTFCSLIYFYPRPPRGGRLTLWRQSWRCWNFYPRPPRGGRPAATLPSATLMTISIHALREEGDGSILYNLFLALGFLSTPSARRATAKTETKSLFSNKLYNILHEFRRALIYNGSKSYPNHAK